FRVQLDRGGEIGQRHRPVTLFPPELATGVEKIGLRRIEPQCDVVIGDGAIDLVLAAEGAGARNQRLQAIGLRGLLIVDQRSAFSILRTRNIFEPLVGWPDPAFMTTTIDDRVRAAVASPARNFYFHMALACVAVAFLGFAPTYWVPLAHRTFSASPVVHFHGF